jgi:hypothetical protein
MVRSSLEDVMTFTHTEPLNPPYALSHWLTPADHRTSRREWWRWPPVAGHRDADASVLDLSQTGMGA